MHTESFFRQAVACGILVFGAMLLAFIGWLVARRTLTSPHADGLTARTASTVGYLNAEIERQGRRGR